MSEAIYKLAFDSIIEADSDKATKALDDADAAGIPLMEVMEKGFAPGMEEFGEMFSDGEVFLPDLILSAKVMSEASERIEKDLVAKGGVAQKKGTAVIATVKGDVHDIGKGIVCTLLRTTGIDVVDLGRDVSADDVIAKAEEVNADIIGTSTLLTTCMNEQQQLEEKLRAQGLRDKYYTIVGGAPVTAKWATKIGASAYANDANEGVKLAVKHLDEKYK